jgi:hypothetical protein
VFAGWKTENSPFAAGTIVGLGESEFRLETRLEKPSPSAWTIHDLQV